MNSSRKILWNPNICSLNAVRTLANQREELAACFFFVPETSEHRTGDGRRVLFLHTTHHHAKVARFDDDSDALRLDHFLNRLGDLRREAFLDLQAPREQLYETWDFAQTNHTPVRDISNMHLAEKWQHMVLTEAEHLDVFHDHHLVVTNGEKSTFEQRFRIFFIALGQELHSLLDTCGRIDQPFARWLLSETD